MPNKRLLHETLHRPLPPAAVNRPKQGFTLPFAQWMSADLQPFVRSGMEHLATAGWIGAGVPDATWRAWQRGELHWTRPWALGLLGAFLQEPSR
jgi:asparagine synthase (glutamine-hydrolysing)